MSGSSLETRSFLDEIRSFDNGGFFDLGHPLLNRIAESFVKAAGIGAVQAVAREAYFTAVESTNGDAAGSVSSGVGGTGRHHRFPSVKGEGDRRSVEAFVKSTGKECVQWGLAAGMYSGFTYGLKEARGRHDWKNSAMAGAMTGAALALTSGGATNDMVVQSAITGAAISTAASLLRGIF